RMVRRALPARLGAPAVAYPSLAGARVSSPDFDMAARAAILQRKGLVRGLAQALEQDPLLAGKGQSAKRSGTANRRGTYGPSNNCTKVSGRRRAPHAKMQEVSQLPALPSWGAAAGTASSRTLAISP